MSFNPARRRRATRLGALVATLTLAGAVQATDVESVKVPAPIPDNILQIGSRSLALGPGHWVLAQRNTFTVGRDMSKAAGRTLDTPVLEPVAVLVEGGQLVAVVDFSLPVREMQDMDRWGADSCARDAGAVRATPGRDVRGRDCRATFEWPSALRALQRSAPEAAAWLAENRIAAPGAALEFIYTQHSSGTFGRLHVLVPKAAFANDAAAAQWSLALKKAVSLMFEDRGRTQQATLPPLPAVPAPSGGVSGIPDPVPASGDAVRDRWLACLNTEAARLDDGVSPAADVGAAVLYRCRDLAQHEAAEIGLVNGIVLEHRAGRGAKR